MPRANQFIPQARSQDLVVTDLDDEILVYDKERDKAHCLNQTAALVWKLSNGKRTVAEIAAAMEKKLGSPVDEQIVWLALSHLEQDHLLRDEIVLPKEYAGITRRDFVKKIGAAALIIALPRISSLRATEAPGLLSCLSNGSACSSSTQCCSQNCVPSGVRPNGNPPAPSTCQPAL